MIDFEQYKQLYNNPNMYDQWDIGPNHERSKFLLSHVLGPKVIELGCGGSGFLRLLYGVYELSAVDINPTWIELGQQRLPDVTYHHSLIEEIDLPRQFNTVVIMEVLEHVIDPELILLKALDLFIEGGKILISVPKAGTQWDWVDNHVRQFTRESLHDLIASITVNTFIVWEQGDYLYAIIYNDLGEA